MLLSRAEIDTGLTVERDNWLGAVARKDSRGVTAAMRVLDHLLEDLFEHVRPDGVVLLAEADTQDFPAVG